MDITQLPFNRLMGIERSRLDGFVLSLPEDDRYTNHLGTVHAGALMALAEAASGDALLGAIGHLADPVVPVVRRFECKFRKPASGSISAKAGIPVAARYQLLTDLINKRRSLIGITVDLYDGAGLHCLSATVEWFVALP